MKDHTAAMYMLVRTGITAATHKKNHVIALQIQ
jgi:hypothetical protein